MVKPLERIAFILALSLILILCWLLSSVILVIVGAILVSALLRLGAEPFERFLHLPRGVALSLSGLILITVIGAAAYIFGARIAAEMQDVLHRVNAGERSITAALEASEFGKLILSHALGTGFSITGVLTHVLNLSVDVVEVTIITFVTGIYLAVEPSLYREGMIKLFPQRLRANVRETLADIGAALRLWLLGELIQMFLIGLLSTLAVWLIGLPSPLALGLIAGVAEFVPYLGPILAAIPALLVATTSGGHAVIWTAVAYTLIHQTEGNLIVPLIQRRMVYIPPAVILLAIVAMSILFGMAGVIFAAPVAVILFVLVAKAYVRDALGDVAEVPGDVAKHGRPKRSKASTAANG